MWQVHRFRGVVVTNDNQQKKYKLEFLIVMCSFGILGPIVKAIGFPSPVIAFFRASIAGISLAIYYFARNKRVDKATRKRCFIPLIICGICLAGDWITLFTAYNYTTVATATICYYIEPILVLIGSGIFLKEKIRTKHLICIIVAFIGVAFVSGIVENGLPSLAELKGVLIAALGAAFYAVIVILNKKLMTDVDPVFKTMFQLLVAAVITMPYVLATEDLSALVFTPKKIALLLFLGIVMTAFTYIFYFSNVVRIPTKTAAIFSYGDPVVAVIVSVLFLHEPISIYGIIGAVLVIGSAVCSELE